MNIKLSNIKHPTEHQRLYVARMTFKDPSPRGNDKTVLKVGVSKNPRKRFNCDNALHFVDVCMLGEYDGHNTNIGILEVEILSRTTPDLLPIKFAGYTETIEDTPESVCIINECIDWFERNHASPENTPPVYKLSNVLLMNPVLRMNS